MGFITLFSIFSLFILYYNIYSILGIIYKAYRKCTKVSLKGRHVLITGGSSGIGKAAAVLSAKAGAHVTIVARDVNKLEEAYIEIKTNTINAQQVITKIAVDVTKMEELSIRFNELEQNVGPIFMLINCAGFAVCGKLEDISKEDIEMLISTNLLGTIYAIKAILPKLKQRKEGIIVLTSSLAGLCGLFGLSVYSATKFALKGLAESLLMELRPYKVSVTLAFPPDTDTPGFVNENQSKPEETKLLSEFGGLVKPEDVAKQLLDDALSKRFFSYLGHEGFMLTNICAGMSPINSYCQLIFQLLLFSPLKVLSILYNKYFEYLIRQCVASKMNNNEGNNI